jgi:hypothetical protein
MTGLVRKLLDLIPGSNTVAVHEALSSALTRPSAPLVYTPPRQETPSKPRFDSTKLFPPKTMTDPAAWDTFWQDQLDIGYAWMNDVICMDGDLIDEMRARGLQTVLCVGSGVSVEPHALAIAGFRVTALDLSPLAIQTASAVQPSAEFLDIALQGRSPRPDGNLRSSLAICATERSARARTT